MISFLQKLFSFTALFVNFSPIVFLLLIFIPALSGIGLVGKG